MLVYGDQSERTTAGAVAGRVADALDVARGAPPGLARHAALVEAFIEAGLLAQGVADAEFAARGCDARSPAQDGAMALLRTLAGAVGASWTSGFAEAALPEGALAGLEIAALPEPIDVRRPEGYAFYALYPEGFFAAAAALGPGEPVRVIGIRSIGAGLAAMVAAGLGAGGLPATLRPVGHPFRREVALAPALAAELLAGGRARFVIVDEGPGLSGSSFGAVADWLEAHGVEPGRIVFFPSHGNDLGPEASPRHRARWAAARRLVVPFEDLVLRAPNPAHRLETWLETLLGPLDGPLEDLSGGRWRALGQVHGRGAPDARFDVPHEPGPAENTAPVHPQQERRKFLARAGQKTWLAKFAGLGREASQKLAMARALHAAGLTAEPVGLCHGFLVERWHGESRPLDPGVDRARLLATLPRYLGFRAREFPASLEGGASLASLEAMVHANAGAALGARALAAWRPDVARLEPRVRRVRIDARLHPWEWRVLPDGRLLKTDALDHHAGHDLVGCQDIAWDVAGAAVEFGLSGPERSGLAHAVGREAGRPVDAALVAFHARAYAAFQLGAWTMAADAQVGDPEAPRLRAFAARYAKRLAALLASPEDDDAPGA